jgi:L-amino acid N-acyltransferase YncA
VNFNIRPAKNTDLDSIARVHVDCQRSTYKGIYNDMYLESLSYEKQEEKWRKRIFNNPDTDEFMYVAETEEGQVVGFASGGLNHDGGAYQGELYTIYILQEFQSKGIGRQLVGAVAENLRQKGISSMIVWAAEDNPCKAFYERLGGKRCGEKAVPKGEEEIRIVGYGWEDTDGIMKSSITLR